MATDNKKERKGKKKKKQKRGYILHYLVTLIHPSTLFSLFVSFACLVLPFFSILSFYIVASSRLFPRLVPHLTYYSLHPFFSLYGREMGVSGVPSGSSLPCLIYLLARCSFVCLLACSFVRRSFSGFLIYDFIQLSIHQLGTDDFSSSLSPFPYSFLLLYLTYRLSPLQGFLLLSHWNE